MMVDPVLYMWLLSIPFGWHYHHADPPLCCFTLSIHSRRHFHCAEPLLCNCYASIPYIPSYQVAGLAALADPIVRVVDKLEGEKVVGGWVYVSLSFDE